ncbi:unnamed protein product, partial [Cylicostephanus goldi]
SDAKSISAEEITEPPTGKELIGRGACAEVYKVVFEGEFVALKRLRGEPKPSDIEALKREAVMINRFRHPNIVNLLGVCLEQPRIGLVLELCEGQKATTNFGMRGVQHEFITSVAKSSVIKIVWVLRFCGGNG